MFGDVKFSRCKIVRCIAKYFTFTGSKSCSKFLYSKRRIKHFCENITSKVWHSLTTWNLWITGDQEKGRPTLTTLCHFHTIHGNLDNCRATAAESSSLHIATEWPDSNQKHLVSESKSLTTTLRTLKLSALNHSIHHKAK